MQRVMAQEAAGAETVSHIRRHRARAEAHTHPVNVVHHDEATLGERIADKVAAGIGSWTFLIVQTFLVFCWVGLNLIGWAYRWDPFPFILLNLMFSVQAAYTGPLLLLAGNRQSQKDRLTLEHAAQEAEQTERRTLTILTEVQRNTEITVQILEHLQAQVVANQEATGRLKEKVEAHVKAGDASEGGRGAAGANRSKSEGGRS